MPGLAGGSHRYTRSFRIDAATVSRSCPAEQRTRRQSRSRETTLRNQTNARSLHIPPRKRRWNTYLWCDASMPSTTGTTDGAAMRRATDRICAWTAPDHASRRSNDPQPLGPVFLAPNPDRTRPIVRLRSIPRIIRPIATRNSPLHTRLFDVACARQKHTAVTRKSNSTPHHQAFTESGPRIWDHLLSHNPGWLRRCRRRDDEQNAMEDRRGFEGEDRPRSIAQQAMSPSRRCTTRSIRRRSTPGKSNRWSMRTGIPKRDRRWSGGTGDRTPARQDRRADRGTRFFSAEVRQMSAADRGTLLDRGYAQLSVRAPVPLLGLHARASTGRNRAPR